MVQYENSVLYKICCRQPTIPDDRKGSTNESRNESLITNRIATINKLSLIIWVQSITKTSQNTKIGKATNTQEFRCYVACSGNNIL